MYRVTYKKISVFSESCIQYNKSNFSNHSECFRRLNHQQTTCQNRRVFSKKYYTDIFILNLHKQQSDNCNCFEKFVVVSHPVETTSLLKYIKGMDNFHSTGSCCEKEREKAYHDVNCLMQHLSVLILIKFLFRINESSGSNSITLFL